MIVFISDHRAEYGVEPICRVLPIAPSTFHEHLAVARDPDRASDRAKRDQVLRHEVQRVRDQNFKVYGVRKVWHQMRREGFDVARCTVERLMRQLGIQGITRGKPQKTTRPDKALPCPRDKVNRQFRAPAPNTLWVSDFTHVSTWQGFVPFRGLRGPTGATVPFTLRHRYLCQPHRRVAGIAITADPVRARCAGTSALRAATGW